MTEMICYHVCLSVYTTRVVVSGKRIEYRHGHYRSRLLGNRVSLIGAIACDFE